MSALARLALRPVLMDFRVDETIPRVFVTIQGPVKGNCVADTLSRAYLDQPETTLMDMLFDLTGYAGEVEGDHIQIIVAAYLKSNREPLHPCRTAFVTADPYFDGWAAAMSYLFIGREHRAFPTFEAAERFLGEPLAARSPFPSPMAPPMDSQAAA